MSAANDDTALPIANHWIVLLRPTFEKIVESASSVEALADDLRWEGNNNIGKDNFIILADGRQFDKTTLVAYTNNVSIDWAIEDYTNKQSSSLLPLCRENTLIFVVWDLLVKSLQTQLAAAVPRLVQRYIVDVFLRYQIEHKRQNESASSDSRQFAELEEGLFWKLLADAMKHVTNEHTTVFRLYLDGDLEKSMGDDPMMEYYNNLSAEKKELLRNLVATINKTLTNNE